MIERVKAMLEQCSSNEPHFPPTDLYNEGWMLRLILDWFSNHNVVDHPLSFPENREWYSEALLASAFLRRKKGDKKAETHTHADGVIGHFKIGDAGKGDIALLPDSSHFVVVEAKMFSKLSSGTTNAKYYNQAARNVACIAEVLKRGKRKPSDFSRLGFYVLAPRCQIEERVFEEHMDPDNIRETVAKRVEDYGGSEKKAWVKEWFNPTMDKISIDVLSWEDVVETIGSISNSDGDDMSEFLECCLKYNARKTVLPLRSQQAIESHLTDPELTCP